MAVLPTPGSPIRTGLFFVRRREDLDDAADLLVAPDHGIEPAGPGLRGQVAAVLLECRVGALGVLGRDALAAADALQRLEDGLAAGTVSLEEGLTLAAGLGHAEQQVFRRDVLVAEAAGLGLGPLDDGLGPRVDGERSALDPGALGEDRGDLAAERWQVDAETSKRLRRDAVIGFDEGATGGVRRRGWGSGGARPSPGRRRRPPGPSG